MTTGGDELVDCAEEEVLDSVGSLSDVEEGEAVETGVGGVEEVDGSMRHQDSTR